VETQLSQSDFDNNCKNNTGVKVTQENISGNPNTTSTGTSGGSDDDDDKPNASGSGSAAAPKATGAATQAQAISWVLGAVGLAGLAML
jgi:hypothetical protein